MEPTTIENWRLHSYTTCHVFTGIIITDHKGRFNCGDHVRSSPIVSFNRKTGRLETQNTVYMMDMDSENQDPYFPEDLGESVMGLIY